MQAIGEGFKETAVNKVPITKGLLKNRNPSDLSGVLRTTSTVAFATYRLVCKRVLSLFGVFVPKCDS